MGFSSSFFTWHISQLFCSQVLLLNQGLNLYLTPSTLLFCWIRLNPELWPWETSREVSTESESDPIYKLFQIPTTLNVPFTQWTCNALAAQPRSVFPPLLMCHKDNSPWLQAHHGSQQDVKGWRKLHAARKRTNRAGNGIRKPRSEGEQFCSVPIWFAWKPLLRRGASASHASPWEVMRLRELMKAERITYSHTKVPSGMSCIVRTPQPIFCVR